MLYDTELGGSWKLAFEAEFFQFFSITRFHNAYASTSGSLRWRIWTKKLLTLEKPNGQIKSTRTWWVLIGKCKSLKKLNSERLTARLGWTVIYFPIFRQARPNFFPEEVRPCLTKYWKIYYSSPQPYGQHLNTIFGPRDGTLTKWIFENIYVSRDCPEGRILNFQLTDSFNKWKWIKKRRSETCKTHVLK